MFDIWAFLDGILSGWIIEYCINKKLNPSFRCSVICKTCNKKTYISTNLKEYINWVKDKKTDCRYITCANYHRKEYHFTDVKIEESFL